MSLESDFRSPLFLLLRLVLSMLAFELTLARNYGAQIVHTNQNREVDSEEHDGQDKIPVHYRRSEESCPTTLFFIRI